MAGIVWIGTSFYFVALDNHLRENVSWEIHGGGFYRIEKFAPAPPRLPDVLHWFKWEAYTTWLSGFALLVFLYYFNATTYLVLPGGPLGTGWSITVSIALLGVAWVVYDVLCRVLRNELVLTAALLGLTTLAAWGATELFAPRAAYVQVGAMLGTIMVANVFFVIIPAHRGLIRAKEAYREPDPGPALEAKRRSVHNNYLTLPVVFAMLSNHFPAAYTHSYSWLVLVALMAIGAWIRHFFNLRHAGRNAWWIPLTAALGIAVGRRCDPADRRLRAARRSRPRSVSFAQANAIVQERCVPCHSEHPTRVSAAPLGIELDTAAEIHAQAAAIERVAVESQLMPLGNATGMTQAERDELGAWIRAGASIK